jgi:hypothetical protein
MWRSTNYEAVFQTFLQQKRLQWAGHKVRPDNSRVPKKVMGGCFRGRRPVGSPRGIWKDAIDLLDTELEGSSKELGIMEEED